MSVAQIDFSRLLSLLTFIGLGILTWMGAQFSDIPRKVAVLETKEVIQAQRLEKMDGKLDMILARLPRE